jgi:hypothetical protein
MQCVNTWQFVAVIISEFSLTITKISVYVEGLWNIELGIMGQWPLHILKFHVEVCIHKENLGNFVRVYIVVASVGTKTL